MNELLFHLKCGLITKPYHVQIVHIIWCHLYEFYQKLIYADRNQIYNILLGV